MKLASLREGGRDGALVVVSRDLTRAVRSPGAATMQGLLDDWDTHAPGLAELAARLETGSVDGEFAFDATRVASPLPLPSTQ